MQPGVAQDLALFAQRPQGSTYLADNDVDTNEAPALRPLQAAACTDRIALALRGGQQVLMLQAAMPRAADSKQTLCAFSHRVKQWPGPSWKGRCPWTPVSSFIKHPVGHEARKHSGLLVPVPQLAAGG